MIPVRTWSNPLDVPLPLGARLAGKLMTLTYRLLGKHRYDDFRLERIRGVPFLVMPSVFNPKIPRTGEFLASLLDGHIGFGGQVLDLGTGSGVCAVFAARHAARVVATDINPAAVRCARTNVLINALEAKVDVRHGDLFEPVRHEQFDVILFNPPFLRGTPRDDRDRAWRSPDIAERFAQDLRAHLKPGGAAFVVLSTFGDARHFLEEFSKHSLVVSVAAERRFANERLAIFRVAPEKS